LHRKKGEKAMQTNLSLVTDQTQELLTSIEVAEMADKRHDNLMRDIDGYCEALANSSALNFEVAEFFIESTYQDAQDKPRPCYLITRKGCDLIANKLTGEKGIKFTAAYVTRFHQMEAKVLPSSIEDLIILQATSMKELREKVERQGETLEVVKIALAPVQDNWRQETLAMFNNIVKKTPDKDHQELRHESYEMLESRAKCNLGIRLSNHKQRLAEAGQTKTAIIKANKLDVIEDDVRLREIYTAILREMAVRCA